MVGSAMLMAQQELGEREDAVARLGAELSNIALGLFKMQEAIFFFMKKAFAIAQWSPESNVIALVLVTRLVGSMDITFNDANWDKVLLCAFLLAQKLWDEIWEEDPCARCQGVEVNANSHCCESFGSALANTELVGGSVVGAGADRAVCAP